MESPYKLVTKKQPPNVEFCHLKITRASKRSAMKKNAVYLAILCWLFFPAVSQLYGKTIKIGTDRWPPHEDIFNENAPGLCTEVVRHVFAEMNIAITIKQYPWARAVDLAFKGKNDALFCALYTDERAEKCIYPEEPLTVLKYLLFIKKSNKDHLFFRSYEDLIGKRIGIVRAFAYPDEFWRFIKQQNNYQEVESDDLNFKKLMTNRIDYAIADHANGSLLMKQMNLTDQILPLQTKVIQESELFIIFSRKTTDVDFVKSFSDVLKKFKQTKSYLEINEKYYGSEACCSD